MAADAETGRVLEPFRKYLRVLAQVHLDARLRGKLDPSDVVQQTFLRACAGFDQLRDREPAVVAAWLRTILARTPTRSPSSSRPSTAARRPTAPPPSPPTRSWPRNWPRSSTTSTG